jgi:hypothetical protein
MRVPEPVGQGPADRRCEAVRHSIVVEVVAGVVLVLAGGAALAQTPGPSVGPSIIPVTGPSPAPGPPEPAKFETLPAPQVRKSNGIRPDGTAEMVTAPDQASRAVKVAHKPGVKTAVKKVPPASKPVAKAGGHPASTKHVAKAGHPVPVKHVPTAKHRASTQHAAASKTVPVAKRQSSSKDEAPAKPVLPRV